MCKSYVYSYKKIRDKRFFKWGFGWLRCSPTRFVPDVTRACSALEPGASASPVDVARSFGLRRVSRRISAFHDTSCELGNLSGDQSQLVCASVLSSSRKICRETCAENSGKNNFFFFFFPKDHICKSSSWLFYQRNYPLLISFEFWRSNLDRFKRTIVREVKLRTWVKLKGSP